MTSSRYSKDWTHTKMGLSTPTQHVMIDDIDCAEWLDEINMSQYMETFTVNFCRGGPILNRSRLSKVRLKDFPHMNITNYEHQKILMEHIRHTLNFDFRSPVRQREVRSRKEAMELSQSNSSSSLPHHRQAQNSSLQGQNGSRKIAPSRSQDSGRKHVPVARRAMKDDLMHGHLNEIRQEILNKIVGLLRCEAANVYFWNKSHFLTCFDGIWYRIEKNCCLATKCWETSEPVIISDGTKFRQQSTLDRQLGRNLRNALYYPCYPTSTPATGGDSLLAVVEATNKSSGAFSQEDIDVINNLLQQQAACELIDNSHADFAFLENSFHCVPINNPNNGASFNL